MNLVANHRQTKGTNPNPTSTATVPPNVLLNLDRKAVPMLKAIQGCRAVLEPVAGGLKVSGVNDANVKGLIGLISSLSFSSVIAEEDVQQELIESSLRIAELEKANAELKASNAKLQQQCEALEAQWAEVNVSNIRLKQELQAKRTSPAPQQTLPGTPHRSSTVVYPGRRVAA